jgi:hypothetical protein
VYAGGDFRSIGGRSRDRIAALDATTGRVMSWNPAANGTVQTIAVSGSTVYAGGGFTAIAGRSRRYVAALSARTGRATAWNPGVARVPKEDSGVLTLAVAGSSLPRRRLHVGGRAHPRPHRRRAGGYWVVTAWNPHADSAVRTLVLSGSTVYAGGAFHSIGGKSRRLIAALSAATGRATAWNPGADNSVLALSVAGSTVYAAGFFSTIGGQPRTFVAGLDARTGRVTAWAPNVIGDGVRVVRWSNQRGAWSSSPGRCARSMNAPAGGEVTAKRSSRPPASSRSCAGACSPAARPTPTNDPRWTRRSSVSSS